VRRRIVPGQHLPRQVTSCGKSGYESERAAGFAVRQARQKGENTHPYYCRACYRWHIGH
jgi:hypothetical protein